MVVSPSFQALELMILMHMIRSKVTRTPLAQCLSSHAQYAVLWAVTPSPQGLIPGLAQPPILGGQKQEGVSAG